MIETLSILRSIKMSILLTTEQCQLLNKMDRIIIISANHHELID
ncbi:hypothetical protein A1OE_367 [Candidatus Endolissoclinum faulkneri L2]|uniref:Uncharacterized protein n=1 Tax=Candidatus Endolissoclinum faulkneri L2 TaxID=1193729 RepID=K7YM37_9PROT|nr:hypothetical protein A1OE_367 [Candidatus Endolissoclinum faulkneri L2]